MFLNCLVGFPFFNVSFGPSRDTILLSANKARLVSPFPRLIAGEGELFLLLSAGGTPGAVISSNGRVVLLVSFLISEDVFAPDGGYKSKTRNKKGEAEGRVSATQCPNRKDAADGKLS